MGAIGLFASDLEMLEAGEQARLAGALGDELRELVALRRSLDVARLLCFPSAWVVRVFLAWVVRAFFACVVRAFLA